MLIIAIPKSASTSLVYTLKQQTKLEIKEGIGKRYYEIDCEGFEEIQTHHSNMIERGAAFLKNVIDSRKVIYREHLIPTDRHLKLLEKINGRVVILLRKVEDVLDCYKRIKNRETDFAQLEKDLNNFYNKYIEFVKQNKSNNFLIVTFEDIMLRYQNTMKKILRHLKLQVPRRVIPYQKKKFTGVGIKRLLGGK